MIRENWIVFFFSKKKMNWYENERILLLITIEKISSSSFLWPLHAMQSPLSARYSWSRLVLQTAAFFPFFLSFRPLTNSWHMYRCSRLHRREAIQVWPSSCIPCHKLYRSHPRAKWLLWFDVQIRLSSSPQKMILEFHFITEKISIFL